MYQTSYQKSMTQLLEVLEVEECQSSSRISVCPVCKTEGNNFGCRACGFGDHYNIQQEVL